MLTNADGAPFRCKGCGAYAAFDLSESDEIKIDPVDLTAVLDEVSNRIQYGQRR